MGRVTAEWRGGLATLSGRKVSRVNNWKIRQPAYLLKSVFIFLAFFTLMREERGRGWWRGRGGGGEARSPSKSQTTDGGGVRREFRRNIKLQGWSSLTALPVVIANDLVLVH